MRPNCLSLATHPERYHGDGKKPPYFEGWYCKLVDASEQQRWAFIPGIFHHLEPGKQHCFVQVLNGVDGTAHYFRYPANAFAADAEPFQVRVQQSIFDLHQISLHLASPELTVEGTVGFHGVVGWPVTWLSPGIMGPFGWLPFLQCYHGVLGLDHELVGSLTINGQQVDFSGGRGYIEKDWGRSFPSGWVWMQSNHFGRPGISLTASIADIPFGPLAFPGFIVGLWLDGRLHRFTTYAGGKVEQLVLREHDLTWVLRNRSERLEIHAHRAASADLRGPDVGDMGVRVAESLTAVIDVRLTDLRGSRVLFEDTGRNAGLEVVGATERLVRP